MLGLRKPHELPLTLGNALNDVVSGAETDQHPEIRHHAEGFDFIPGNRVLSAVEIGLVNVMSRETVLRRYLEEVKAPYDYLLLDCRPSLGMLVINALSASDYVLIPVQADYLAAEDMTELIGTVQNIKRQINPRLRVGGVFLTMANETNFRRDIVAAVKENFGKRLPVMQAVIPATVRLAEVSTADKSILGWRELNSCRLSTALIGAFRPFRLDGRQPACVSKAENHSIISRRQVRSSFFGADFCPDKEKSAANTLCIRKGFDAVWAKIGPQKTGKSSTSVSLSMSRRERRRVPTAHWLRR